MGLILFWVKVHAILDLIGMGIGALIILFWVVFGSFILVNAWKEDRRRKRERTEREHGNGNRYH